VWRFLIDPARHPLPPEYQQLPLVVSHVPKNLKEARSLGVRPYESVLLGRPGVFSQTDGLHAHQDVGELRDWAKLVWHAKNCLPVRVTTDPEATMNKTVLLRTYDDLAWGHRTAEDHRYTPRVTDEDGWPVGVLDPKGVKVVSGGWHMGQEADQWADAWHGLVDPAVTPIFRRYGTGGSALDLVRQAGQQMGVVALARRAGLARSKLCFVLNGSAQLYPATLEVLVEASARWASERLYVEGYRPRSELLYGEDMCAVIGAALALPTATCLWPGCKGPLRRGTGVPGRWCLAHGRRSSIDKRRAVACAVAPSVEKTGKEIR
jgi:hypothetical protein